MGNWSWTKFTLVSAVLFLCAIVVCVRLLGDHPPGWEPGALAGLFVIVGGLVVPLWWVIVTVSVLDKRKDARSK